MFFFLNYKYFKKNYSLFRYKCTCFFSSTLTIMQEHYLSAVRDIHKRLKHLESIWDAGAIQDNVRSKRHPVSVTVQHSLRNTSKNQLYFRLKNMGAPASGYICEMPDCPVPYVDQLTFDSQPVHSSHRTDGLEGEVIIFECNIGGQPTVVKFRRGKESESGTMTENELRHTNILSQNPVVASLFPKMYFALSLAVPDEWEGLGMQKVEKFTEEEMRKEDFYQKCFKVLCTLHAQTFTHGDAHSYNFMKDPATGKTLLIDRDRCSFFPAHDDPPMVAAMVSFDFHKLLMLNNIHMRFLQSFEQNSEKKGKLYTVLYKAAKELPPEHAEMRELCRFVLWPTYMNRFNPDKVRETFAAYPGFARHMRATNMIEIRRVYGSLFSSAEKMVRFNAFLKKLYSDNSKEAEVEVHDLTEHADLTDLTKDDIQVIHLTEHAGSTDLTKDDIEVIDLTEEEPMVNSHAREFSWGN